jgi:hypothetical protein
MRGVKCALPLHRNRRDGSCYCDKKKAEEAQAELGEWVAAE